MKARDKVDKIDVGDTVYLRRIFGTETKPSYTSSMIVERMLDA